MPQIPDFTDSERWVIRSALTERYGRSVEVQLADAELRLDPGARELTVCPTVFWKERGASFAIFKVGEQRFRNQFFYSVRDQYGTGRDEYSDIAECVTVLLQVQADHERAKGMDTAGER